MLSQLGHIMVGVVDTAMVGQIGTIPQAAVALANSFYVLVLVFGLGVAYGVTPLVAAADSSKNYSRNANLLKHSIIINTATGVILFLLLVRLSPTLRLYNQKKEVVDLAIPFLNVMMLGMIPLCIFSGFKQFAEGLSFTRIAMMITLGTNVLNVSLNYLLIFGHCGFPKMGLMGACWGSFISRMAMALAMFLYVYYNKHFKIYWRNFNFKNISKDLIKIILALGIPSGLQWVFELGAFSFAVIMIGWISPEAQAAHQIALCIAALTYMMASGLSAATSVRVGNQLGLKNQKKRIASSLLTAKSVHLGNQLGLKNRKEMRIAGFSSFILVLIFMSIASICIILFRDVLPSIFNQDRKVISIASSLLVIVAFFQLSDGVQSVGLGALRGIKDVRIPTLITLIAYWGIGLPMSYVFGFMLNMGVQGVWYGLSLGLATAALLLFWRFNYVSKRI
jgi:MATE family multidrug resistance protein